MTEFDKKTAECQEAFTELIKTRSQESREKYGRLLFELSAVRAHQNSDGTPERIVRMVLGRKTK